MRGRRNDLTRNQAVSVEAGAKLLHVPIVAREEGDEEIIFAGAGNFDFICL